MGAELVEIAAGGRGEIEPDNRIPMRFPVVEDGL
jgi:hypothetical protein